MLERAQKHLIGADPLLSTVIAAIGPCRLRVDRRREPYAALVKSVAYQQLNGTAAAAIFNRMLALFPNSPFPSPQELLDAPAERLRSAGLSAAKVAAIKEIAAHAATKMVPTRAEAARMQDSELIERLTAIRGVGPWTVEMLLIFTLGRRDVLPATDYGVRKGFALTYGTGDLPTPRQLLEFGERWRPYRSIASWYLWRALDRQ